MGGRGPAITAANGPNWPPQVGGKGPKGLGNPAPLLWQPLTFSAVPLGSNFETKAEGKGYLGPLVPATHP